MKPFFCLGLPSSPSVSRAAPTTVFAAALTVFLTRSLPISQGHPRILTLWLVKKLMTCPCANPSRPCLRASPLRCSRWRLPSWHLEKVRVLESWGSLVTAVNVANPSAILASQSHHLHPSRHVFHVAGAGSGVSTSPSSTRRQGQPVKRQLRCPSEGVRASQTHRMHLLPPPVSGIAVVCTVATGTFALCACCR